MLDRFPQRDFGLWVFMCPINFSVSLFRLPRRGLPRPTALSGYHSEGYHAPPLFSRLARRGLPRPYICNQANRLPRLQGYHTRATTLQKNFWVQAGYHTCGWFLAIFPFIGNTSVSASTTTFHRAWRTPHGPTQHASVRFEQP